MGSGGSAGVSIGIGLLQTGDRKIYEGNNKPATNARAPASGLWSWRRHQLIAMSGKQTDQQQNRSNVNSLFVSVIKIIAALFKA